MNYYYKFPVVRGVQAGKNYYIGMVPLKMISKLFSDDAEIVLPEYRAQRKLNEQRIPDIKKYILDNKSSYVFSALAASIDGEFSFVESLNGDTGILEIEMSAKLVINDGQHRKAAIIAAIEEDESIGNETISVVFYEDMGLARSQQMFTDLNKHAVKTSNSIAELYDSRDLLAVYTRTMISENQFLNEFVDKERDNLGKYSSNFFTLNTFYIANKRILKGKECDEEFNIFINMFWRIVSEMMSPWVEVKNKEISKKELREEYIATQAVIIQALGRVGDSLYLVEEEKLIQILSGLKTVNWKRNAKEWNARVIRSNGRIMNNSESIILAGNAIKTHLGIELSEDEKNRENDFKHK